MKNKEKNIIELNRETADGVLVNPTPTLTASTTALTVTSTHEQYFRVIFLRIID